MANIREYANPLTGLEPSETGIHALSTAAVRGGAFFSQAAESLSDTGRRAQSAVDDIGNVAVKFVDHQQISAGAPLFASKFSDLDSEWNTIVKGGKDADGNVIPPANPNDPTIRQKFLEERVKPEFDNLRAGFTTEKSRAYADGQIERLQEHLSTKTAADMSTRARQATSLNVETLTNQLSNAAISDPSSVKASLALLEHSVREMVESSPNLRGVDAGQITSEVLLASQKAVVKAAAIGEIAINPEAGLKKWSSPEYSKFISGSELRQLEQQAKYVQRGQHADENYRRINEERKAQDASDAREGEYLSKLHSGDHDVAATVSAKAIANDFTLTRAARERMIGIVERETKPEAAARVSNGTASDLVARIRLPVGDPNRIDSLDPVYDAYEKGKLNKGDLKFVRDEFANIRTPEGEALGRRQADFVHSVKPQLDKSNPLMGKMDPVGAQKVYEFTVDLQRKVMDYRRAGKNPYDLMDPSKPDYMGSEAALLPYQKPLQDSARDAVKRIRAGSGLPSADQITGTQSTPSPVATSVPRPAAVKPPEKGTVKDGYEFLGGNPGDAANWKKVQ